MDRKGVKASPAGECAACRGSGMFLNVFSACDAKSSGISP